MRCTQAVRCLKSACPIAGNQRLDSMSLTYVRHPRAMTIKTPHPPATIHGIRRCTIAMGPGIYLSITTTHYQTTPEVRTILLQWGNHCITTINRMFKANRTTVLRPSDAVLTADHFRTYVETAQRDAITETIKDKSITAPRAGKKTSETQNRFVYVFW